MNNEPLLEVHNLSVAFSARGQLLPAVRGISFRIAAGERLGLLGESGSGKTVTALAMLRLLPRHAIVSGEVMFDGCDLLQMGERELRSVRGARIGMVFQNPMTALNPVRRIGDQLAAAIRVHADLSTTAAHTRAIDLLEEVNVTNARARLRAYPHEFSGGMRQRVVIALALAGDPDLIIADEATTALDVTTQARVIALLRDIAERRNMASIFVTHDLAVAASFCTDVQVMYGGRIVERAPAPAFYESQLHPYSKALIAATCDLHVDPSAPIQSIPGQPPMIGRLPAGCAFHDRCPEALPVCSAAPPPAMVLGARLVECHLFAETD